MVIKIIRQKASWAIEADHNSRIVLPIEAVERAGWLPTQRFKKSIRTEHGGKHRWLQLFPVDKTEKRERGEITLRNGAAYRCYFEVQNWRLAPHGNHEGLKVEVHGDVIRIQVPEGMKELPKVPLVDRDEPEDDIEPAPPQRGKRSKPASEPEPEVVTLIGEQITAAQELVNFLGLTGIGQRVMDYLETRGFADPQAAIDDLRKALF